MGCGGIAVDATVGGFLVVEVVDGGEEEWVEDDNEFGLPFRAFTHCVAVRW